MNLDLLIHNVPLLPMVNGSCTIINPGFVGIKDGTIIALGPMTEIPATYEAGRIIGGKGVLAMPGLINGHCHAAMTLFRGMADDLPLMTWLQEHIFPAEARFVSPEMVYWCSKLAAVEMMLAGITTVADGYFYEHHAAQAFMDSGMRAIPAQGVIDFPAPGVPDPSKNIAVAEDYLKTWKTRSRRIIPAVFCHSPYTCSSATLQRAKEVASAHDSLFFIHAAETRFEVEQCVKEYGKTPVSYLQDLGVLDHRTVLIHGVWLLPEEVDMVAEAASSVVTCPESNMKLASGIAPLSGMIQKNIRLGIGTDGCASNNDLELFGEMDRGAKLQKVSGCDSTLMSAGQMLGMATWRGAGALGLKEHVGSLEAGKRADIILINIDQPHLAPFYNADLLVYAARGADVQSVIIDGELVVEDRKILGFDVQEVMERVNALAEEVRSDLIRD